MVEILACDRCKVWINNHPNIYYTEVQAETVEELKSIPSKGRYKEMLCEKCFEKYKEGEKLNAKNNNR